jgi:hypothetical protein
MERFMLRAHLRSPFVQQGFTTLDALLMAVLARGDVSDLLMCEDELYHASAAMPVDVVERRPKGAQFVASMRPQQTPEWLDVIKPNTLDGDLKIGIARQREAGNITNSYAATVALAVEWAATGDMRAVLEVVQSLTFIGKRRASGFGEVARWEVEPGGLDGLVGYLSEPLRPIPTERWEWGGDWIPVEAAWKAPYWDVRNRTRCFVPDVQS